MRDRLLPSRRSGLTSVTSTATYTPPRAGSPCATTPSRRPSVNGSPRFKSRRKTLVATRAPASREMRAAAGSREQATPAVGQAARWSPRSSRAPPQRQARASSEAQAPEEHAAEGVILQRDVGAQPARALACVRRPSLSEVSAPRGVNLTKLGPRHRAAAGNCARRPAAARARTPTRTRPVALRAAAGSYQPGTNSAATGTSWQLLLVPKRKGKTQIKYANQGSF